MNSQSIQPAGSTAPEPRRDSDSQSESAAPTPTEAVVHSPEQISRVLHRAMELAAVDSGDLGKALHQDAVLGEASLVEIADELGIPLDAVAGALVEARLDVGNESRSLLDWLVGPVEVWARRPTSESEEEVKARLLTWLERGHGLKPRIRHNGIVVAKRRRDLVGKLGNTVRGVQGAGGLSKAQEIEAVVVDLRREEDSAEGSGVEAEFDLGPANPDDGVGVCRGSIGLSADLTDRRTGAIAKGAAVAMGGTAVITLASLAMAPASLFALPVAAGAGLLTSRKLYSSSVRSMTDAVEETIDGIVTKTDPPRLLGGRRRRSR